MGNDAAFVEIFQEYVKRSLYSAGQLAALTDIPKTSIENWLSGLSKRPRRWQDILRLALALHLEPGEVDRLLQAARHPILDVLQSTAPNPEDRVLLAHWAKPENPKPVPLTADEPTIVQSLSAPRQPILEQLPPPSTAPLPWLSRTYATFCGRSDELELLSKWLIAPDVRMITVWGMSGIGKSSLVFEAAMRNQKQFPFGIYSVSAREISHLDLDIVAAALLTQMIGAYASPQETPTLILQYYLRKYPALVIFDNANSLIPAMLQKLIDYLRHALPESGGSKAIITTQSYLHDLASWHFARSLHLHIGLSGDAALDLIKHANQAFDIPGKEPIIRQIIDKLHGHPKLLEVAIGKAKRWGWEQTYQEVSAITGDIAATWSQMILSASHFLPEETLLILEKFSVFATATFLADELKALLPYSINLQAGLEQLVDLSFASYDMRSGTYIIHQLVSDYVDKYNESNRTVLQAARIQLVQCYVSSAKLG